MMSLRVIIVPDKFKGTLTALAAAKAIAKGWRAVRSTDVLEIIPMSDGGDGFGLVTSSFLGGHATGVSTVDAAHRNCKATFYLAKQSRTAIFETANVVGLAMLPRAKYHPFQLDTFGLGKVLVAASESGATTCLLGIGGSATNDGGFGLARALGFQFLGRSGEAIVAWTDLGDLHRIIPPGRNRLFKKVIVATDVANPLLGPRGCSRIYGPQKGLREKDFPLADKALGRLAKKVKELLGNDVACVPGAGAAGGLGFGLVAFLGAELVSGFDLFAKQSKLYSKLRKAQLVITGEGSLDRSTLMGKGVGGIASLCKDLKIACVGLGGRVVQEDLAILEKTFVGVLGLTPDITTPEAAMAQPAKHLTALAKRLAISIS